MKDNILFWVSKDLLAFGIANELQKKYDANLYAIVETYDKPKKFFQNQNLVNFKKTWYLDNLNVQNKKPDIEYLKTKESEYDMSLWDIAYSERLFAGYSKYHIFSHDEIFSLLEQEFILFEKILDEAKPNFVIMRIPDFHHLKMFHALCRKKNIKVLIMNRTKFSLNLWYVSQEPNKIDISEKVSEHTIRTISDIDEKLKELDSKKQLKKQSSQGQDFFDMLTKKTLRSILELFLSRGINNDRDRFLDVGRTRTKLLLHTISALLKAKYRESFINNKLKKRVQSDRKFAYFPLHVEPERALLIDSPYFVNQIEVIKNVAKSLPVDYVLYVKEHPIMKKLKWRKTSFYKQIMDLPNVVLIHPDVDSQELIKNCSIVITITGTSGLQAAFFKKPSITFADTIYSKLPSAFRVNNIEELPVLIKTALNTEIDEKELVNIVNHIVENSFEFDNLELVNEFYPFQGAVLSNLELKNEQMENFLDKNKKLFEKLAHEHIKKITKLKENPKVKE